LNNTEVARLLYVKIKQKFGGEGKYMEKKLLEKGRGQ
jgi:hypothetical protein